MFNYFKELYKVYKNYLNRITALDVLRNYLITAATVFITFAIFSNITVDSFYTILSFSLLLLFANVFVAPIVNLAMIRITVLTFGLFSIILNAIILGFIVYLQVGVNFEGKITTLIAINFLLILILGVVTSITSSTPMDRFEVMFLKSITERDKTKKGVKGIYFLEIDGLSEEILEYAIENGYADTLKRWRKNSHTLMKWECGVSSQTSASQAGILHGKNDMIPAFRWLDRKTQTIFTSNKFANAKELQKTVSNGKGLLADDGISFNNMFNGDSPESSLNISDFGSYDERKEAMKLYFINPQALMRSVVFALFEIMIELKDLIWQQLTNEKPRVPRKLSYVIGRALTNVILRDLSVYRVIDAMIKGHPSLYTTFISYDEVAHHAGIINKSTMKTLRRLDDQFAKIEYMSKYLPNDYQFVVLSDHGQSQGWTFKQRFGYSLAEFVEEKIGGNEVDNGIELEEEHQADLQQTVKLFTRRNKKKKTKLGKSVVLASGNQGLIFFTGSKTRLTVDEINKKYPELIDALASHDGVQFIMVKLTAKETVIMNNYGKRYLYSGKIEKKDPLWVYESKNLIESLKKYDQGPNAPDIMVISMYDRKTEEVAAFEELVGSHGGIGGPQSFPFILYPNKFDSPTEEIIGAENVYPVLKGWLKKYSVKG